jgi:hypothetical protein
MLQRNLTVIVVVVVAVSTSVFAGCDEQAYTKGEGTELARVTSPNGQLDAVLMQYIYGGAVGGGVDSNVYIVRKGAGDRNGGLYFVEYMYGGWPTQPPSENVRVSDDNRIRFGPCPKPFLFERNNGELTCIPSTE